MYHVVICQKDYYGPFVKHYSRIFKNGEVYQAENHGDEFRVWRSNVSFLKFSPSRFKQYFRIFC